MSKKNNTSPGGAANANRTVEFKEKYSEFVKRNVVVSK